MTGRRSQRFHTCGRNIGSRTQKVTPLSPSGRRPWLSSAAMLPERLTSGLRSLSHPMLVRQLPGNLRAALRGDRARAMRLRPRVPAMESEGREPCVPTPFEGPTKVPVERVTPADGLYTHTYSDVCPFSPSGRFLAVTRIPFHDRHPRLGDEAEVRVVDLQERTIETVYRTWAWCIQLGAHLHWGPTDDLLLTNDVIGGEAIGVALDLAGREARPLAGPLYDTPRDGSWVVGTALDRINLSQLGYGAPLTAWPRTGTPSDAGVARTELMGPSRMLVSTEAMVSALPDADRFGRGVCALAHTKVAPDGGRIFQVVRSLPPLRRSIARAIVTFGPGGGDLRCAFTPAQWQPGGHHPAWCPDGEHLVMNVVLKGTMRFARFRYDGSGLEPLSDRHLGSGHPTIHPAGRFLVTDSYQHEAGISGPGPEIPIRLLDLRDDTLEVLFRMPSRGGLTAFACDLHPVWSRDGRKLCLNGAPGDQRAVFVADLAGITGIGD